MSATLQREPAAGSETINEAILALQSGENIELPVLPEVAAELLKLTNDVECNISDVVPLIKRDQSLTSHLLRIANSARYNTGVTVSSVQQAVARLGLLAVREIVVLISCKCRVFDVPEFESHVRHSFRRSLATAAFGQEIARVRRMNVEEAFLSGLLHDIGRPVLFQALVDRRKTHGLVATEAETLEAAEEHRILLAAKLIAHWELSERVVETVRHQLIPLQAPNCALQSATLNLALHLAEDMLDPASRQNGDNEPHPMLEVLGLYPEQFATIKRNSNQILEWVDSTI
ncbi:MAG: HDOD domain-containing protein [Planctomycetaceae bacterium]